MHAAGVACMCMTLDESCSIIESVDSISRDGPDTPICVIYFEMPKKLTQNKNLKLQIKTVVSLLFR